MAGIHNVLAGGTNKIRPVFVSASVVTTSTTRLVTITAPASIVAGTLLIAFVNGDDASTQSPSVPSGWTVLVNDTANRFIATKTATDAEPASYSIGFAAGSFATASGVIVQYSGAAVAVVSATTASVIDPTASITVSQNLSLLLAFVSANQGSNTYTSPTPGTWTNRARRGTASSQAIFDRAIESGSTGTVTFNTTQAARGTLISLSPL